MKKCHNCGAENPDGYLFCKQCKSYHIRGKPERKRKPVEYVRVAHGYMKKSTYDRLNKRDGGFANVMWFIFGVSIFVALIKGCN